jgi:hypothetical protein
MGLFKKKKQPEPAAATDAKLYYSTPFGDTKDGKQNCSCSSARAFCTCPLFIALSR